MNLKSDRSFMLRALELAVQARGRTNPNPMVGAVIVKDGLVVGEGYHHKAGTPHAEVHALNMAGEKANGAIVYVTLEPCSHYGKTPPCADALIRAGVRKVVVATLDPNPKVSGRGLQKLRDAGIEVELGLCEEEAQKLNEVFFKYIQSKLPFVLLKTAMTLDGKIATVTGDSRWISNEYSRNYVHQLRDQMDAILVGIGTVIKDDPLLNTRLDRPDKKDPIRVIVDTHLDIPLSSRIVTTSQEQRTIIFCSENADSDKKQALLNRGIEIINMKPSKEGLSLPDILRILGEMRICSLLVEGGSEIAASFLNAHLVDKVCWFISPKILGGRKAPSPVGGEGIAALKNAIKLRNLEVQRFAEDICITGYIDQ